jgi:hypothetical protein
MNRLDSRRRIANEGAVVGTERWPLDEPLFWFVDFAREKKEVGGRLASSYF